MPAYEHQFLAIKSFNLKFKSRKDSRNLRETDARLLLTYENGEVAYFTGTAKQYIRDNDCKVLGQKAALSNLFRKYEVDYGIKFTRMERKAIWDRFLSENNRLEKLNRVSSLCQLQYCYTM